MTNGVFLWNVFCDIEHMKRTMRTTIGRSLLGILMLISGTLVNAQEAHWIKWEENKKLNWDDFASRADRGSSFEALTASGFLYEMTQTSETDFELVIYSYFDKKQSWVNKDEKKDKLLQHEQLHFDLTELHCRKFKKAILERKFKTAEEVNEAVKDLFKILNDQLNKQHDRYDKETDHSINEAEQTLWNERVLDQLKDLKELSRLELTIELK